MNQSLYAHMNNKRKMNKKFKKKKKWSMDPLPRKYFEAFVKITDFKILLYMKQN
jgi:hypothetical protein